MDRRLSTKDRWADGLIASVVLVVFSYRWHNTWPWGSHWPLVVNSDQLDAFARFLFFAKEEWRFPIAIIDKMFFPFGDNSVLRGTFPILALPLKALATFFEQFGGVYYFIFAELLIIFLCAYWATKIINIGGNVTWPFRLLCAVVIGLAPPLLFRSSLYQAMPFLMTAYPVYLALVLCFLRIGVTDRVRPAVMLLILICVLPLIDYYTVFSVLSFLTISMVLGAVGYFLEWRHLVAYFNRRFVLAVICGVGLFFIFVSLLGHQTMPSVPEPGMPNIFDELLDENERKSENWGYGNGFGGGFHVADFLAPVIPPQGKTGPDALLTKMGFPLSMESLEAGQSTGFAFIGTVALMTMLVGLVGMFLRLIWRRCRKQMFLTACGNLFGNKRLYPLFGCILILAIWVIVMFSFSWGYILHIAGERFPDIAVVGGVRVPVVPTPALMLTLIHPDFMYARSLGRLVAPLALFLIMASIAIFYYLLVSTNATPRWGGFATVLCLVLSVVHVVEISGYLKTTPVQSSKPILGILDQNTIVTVKSRVRGRKALLIAPDIRSSLEWLELTYAYGYYADLPMSGVYAGLGVSKKVRYQTRRDVNEILMGNYESLFRRYGDVAIMVRAEDFGRIIIPSAQKDFISVCSLPGIFLIVRSANRNYRALASTRSAFEAYVDKHPDLKRTFAASGSENKASWGTVHWVMYGRKEKGRIMPDTLRYSPEGRRSTYAFAEAMKRITKAQYEAGTRPWLMESMTTTATILPNPKFGDVHKACK